MSIRKFLLIAAFTVLSACPRPVSAEIINLESHVVSRLEKDSLSFELTVKNSGDEEALEIGLEFPSLTRRFPVASALATGESKSTSLLLTLAELGTKGNGSYTIPYRLTFKDPNGYALSNAQLLMINQEPVPSRQLAIRFDGAGPAPELHVTENGSLRVSGEIKNLGGQPVELTALSAVSALELRHDVVGAELPKTLQPRESLSFKMDIVNEGALRSSSCAAFFIAEGQVEGMRLSEHITYKVLVDPPAVISRWLLLGAVVITLMAILGLKRRKLGKG